DLAADFFFAFARAGFLAAGGGGGVGVKAGGGVGTGGMPKGAAPPVLESSSIDLPPGADASPARRRARLVMGHDRARVCSRFTLRVKARRNVRVVRRSAGARAAQLRVRSCGSSARTPQSSHTM